MQQLTETELEAVHQTFHRLETRWHLPIPPVNGWHVYDPLPIAMFVEGIRVAISHTKGLRFADLGCGIGTKLAFMHALGFEVFGVDHVHHYIEAARELIPQAHLTEGDIRDYNPDADIVFMYRPARSDDLEEEMEQTVAARMRPGSVLYLPVRPLPDGFAETEHSDIGVKL